MKLCCSVLLLGNNFYDLKISQNFMILGDAKVEAPDSRKEELLQSVSNFIFKLIFSKPRGVMGVQRSEIYWEIQKYSLPVLRKIKNHY